MSTERHENGNCHTEACRSTRCPCYLAGRPDPDATPGIAHGDDGQTLLSRWRTRAAAAGAYAVAAAYDECADDLAAALDASGAEPAPLADAARPTAWLEDQWADWLARSIDHRYGRGPGVALATAQTIADDLGRPSPGLVPVWLTSEEVAVLAGWPLPYHPEGMSVRVRNAAVAARERGDR